MHRGQSARWTKLPCPPEAANTASASVTMSQSERMCGRAVFQAQEALTSVSIAGVDTLTRFRNMRK